MILKNIAEPACIKIITLKLRTKFQPGVLQSSLYHLLPGDGNWYPAQQ
jgi:hypothetical protein